MHFKHQVTGENWTANKGKKIDVQDRIWELVKRNSHNANLDWTLQYDYVHINNISQRADHLYKESDWCRSGI